MIAYLRNVWRALTNRYDGAHWSRRRSRAYGTPQAARYDATASTRLELVTQARDAEANDATVNRMCDIWETYTVGTGLHVQPSSSDADWNAKAREWWVGWERYCDETSLLGFASLTGLISRTWFIDGEVFILWTKGQSGTPRIQVLEGHNFGTPPERQKDEGISVIDGVEISPSGRPIGYWRIHAKDAAGKVRYEQIPADAVIHVFEPSRPGQYRGLPFLYPVINDLLDLKDLRELEMAAAKDAAEITNVYKTETGELSSQELRQSRFGIPTAGASTTPADRTAYYRDAAPGRNLVLKSGDSIEQFRSDRPSVACREHWRYLTERVCSGVGIAYVMVYPDSMQGTVYRGSLDMASSMFRARSLVIADVVQRIWERVMGWARYGVPALRDAPANWYNVMILPPRAPNVDVGYNAAATLAGLQSGTTHYGLVYGPQGLDWRQQFDALSEQQNYAREKGLILPGIAGLGPKEEADPKEDETPAEEIKADQ